MLKITNQHNVDLFRYGGDEFIMMSNSISVDEIKQLLKEVNMFLSKLDRQLYEKSISYGVVSGDSSDYIEMIEDADKTMYEFKKEHYEGFVRR